MMYALDTEFIENGKTIDLISIGIMAEDGRTFYVQNRDAQWSEANPFVREHVFPALECFSVLHEAPMFHTDRTMPGHHITCPWLFHRELGDAVEGFIYPDTLPIFWGYYSAYDWVALCQCFGMMVDLPMGWPMYCRDLRQWLDNCGHPEISQPDDMPHHALSDARWIMQTLLTGHGVWKAGIHDQG